MSLALADNRPMPLDAATAPPLRYVGKADFIQADLVARPAFGGK